MKSIFLILLGVSILSQVFFYRVLRDHYVDVTPLVKVSVYPLKDRRMLVLFKGQCKDKHGAEYVDRYMDCTADKMNRYLKGEYDVR